MHAHTAMLLTLMKSCLEYVRKHCLGRMGESDTVLFKSYKILLVQPSELRGSSAEPPLLLALTNALSPITNYPIVDPDAPEGSALAPALLSIPAYSRPPPVTAISVPMTELVGAVLENLPKDSLSVRGEGEGHGTHGCMHA